MLIRDKILSSNLDNEAGQSKYNGRGGKRWKKQERTGEVSSEEIVLKRLVGKGARGEEVEVNSGEHLTKNGWMLVLLIAWSLCRRLKKNNPANPNKHF